jgi:hypothetical protein
MRKATAGQPLRGAICGAAFLASALLLCACAPLRQEPKPAGSQTPASGATADGATIAPNANLFVQGIPPIPKGVADAVARYNDFRGHSFVDWHPTKPEMLVAHRKAGGNTTQIFRVAGPLAEPVALTDLANPVRHASYEPLKIGRAHV